MHFELLTKNRRLNGGKAPSAIHGAQRAQAGFRTGDDTICAIGRKTFGLGDQDFEEIDRDPRHIAGDNQIPGRVRGRKSGMQASQRSTTIATVSRQEIGDDGMAQVPVAIRSTHQDHVAGRGQNPAGDGVNQHGTFKGQEGFVAAHTGTSAAGQDETSAAVNTREGHGKWTLLDFAPIRGHSAAHEKMVTICQAVNSSMVVANKKVYICSLLAIAMLAASPMRAADLSVASAAPAASAPEINDNGRTALVVRVDPKTGKLIRTTVAQKSRPASVGVPAAIGPATAPANTKSASIPSRIVPSRVVPSRIAEIVDQSARAHHVDPLLVHSVIQQESNYNLYAVSPKGAEGLMQLTPSTAAMLGVSNSFDPQQNIEAGVKYLKQLQDLYNDDRLALAAYNAGPGAVDKYKWIPPYPETQKYVDQVGKRYDAARQAAAAQVRSDAPESMAAQADPSESIAQEDRHPKLEQSFDENGRLSLKTTQ